MRLHAVVILQEVDGEGRVVTQMQATGTPSVYTSDDRMLEATTAIGNASDEVTSMFGALLLQRRDRHA